MLPNSTPSLRDLAIKQITEGTNRYNTSNNFEEKKKGYDLFILGVQNMMKSGKSIYNLNSFFSSFHLFVIFIASI